MELSPNTIIEIVFFRGSDSETIERIKQSANSQDSKIKAHLNECIDSINEFFSKRQKNPPVAEITKAPIDNKCSFHNCLSQPTSLSYTYQSAQELVSRLYFTQSYSISKHYCAFFYAESSGIRFSDALKGNYFTSKALEAFNNHECFLVLVDGIDKNQLKNITSALPSKEYVVELVGQHLEPGWVPRLFMNSKESLDRLHVMKLLYNHLEGYISIQDLMTLDLNLGKLAWVSGLTTFVYRDCMRDINRTSSSKKSLEAKKATKKDRALSALHKYINKHPETVDGEGFLKHPQSSKVRKGIEDLTGEAWSEKTLARYFEAEGFVRKKRNNSDKRNA